MTSVATESQSARSLRNVDLATLRESITGQVLVPGDKDYDAARTIWNAMIDRRPAVIVRCLNSSDVRAAVQFAATHGLPISIKGGGHNVAGNALGTDALMIDLSAMKRVELDPTHRIARSQPGVLWQEFDATTGQHGLATVGGVVGTTGIAGLTLGGGQGWLTGKYGLTIDNLRSATLVTADGELRRASLEDNPELFWALRGAGANFGVVTEIEYDLHPVSTVLGGMVIYELSQARDILRSYRDFAAAQPDEATTFAALLNGPSGDLVLVLVTCYVGSIDAGEQMLAPIRGFGGRLLDTIAPIPYQTMQGLIGQGFPHDRRNYWKSGLTNVVSDAMIDAIVEYGAKKPSPHGAVVIGDCHGAYARVPQEATAYRHRDLQFDFMILSSWEDADEDNRNIDWTHQFFDAVAPELGQAVYVNDLGHDEIDSRVRLAYGDNYSRLRRLKGIYDPMNIFRFNQNIPPA